MLFQYSIIGKKANIIIPDFIALEIHTLPKAIENKT